MWLSVTESRAVYAALTAVQNEARTKALNLEAQVTTTREQGEP